MDLGIAGRRAVVTGAAGGIGGAVARLLAAEGAVVAGIDRMPAPDVGVAVVADVTDASSVRRGVADVAASLGGVDILVCCAGVSGPVGTPLEHTALADWNLVFDVNVTGTFLVLRECLPWLRRSAHAAVVLVSSDSALVATPGMAPYSASKAAVRQLARAAAVELAPDGIRVNAICPSIVDTPMSRTDLGVGAVFAGVDYPVQTADELAAGIAYLVSPRARAVNAASLVADFAYSARSGFPA